MLPRSFISLGVGLFMERTACERRSCGKCKAEACSCVAFYRLQFVNLLGALSASLLGQFHLGLGLQLEIDRVFHGMVLAILVALLCKLSQDQALTSARWLRALWRVFFSKCPQNIQA